MITAAEPSWIPPFTGQRSRDFRKLVTLLRREGADRTRRERPWSLSAGRSGAPGRRVLVDQPDIAAARPSVRHLQVICRPDQIIDHIEPLLAVKQRQRALAKLEPLHNLPCVPRCRVLPPVGEVDMVNDDIDPFADAASEVPG